MHLNYGAYRRYPRISHNYIVYTRMLQLGPQSSRSPRPFRSPHPMDSPIAFDSNFSIFFSLFLYNQFILLLVFLLCYRSLLLIRLKSFLGFFLSFFHSSHHDSQAILVVEEYRNQELFGSIHTYITHKLLHSVGGVVEITKPKHSNTLIWRLDRDREISDRFRGVPLKWVLRVKQENGLIGRFRKSRYFELCVPEKHLAEVCSLYLQFHVQEEAARIRRNNMIPHVGWLEAVAGLLIQLIDYYTTGH